MTHIGHLHNIIRRLCPTPYFYIIRMLRNCFSKSFHYIYLLNIVEHFYLIYPLRYKLLDIIFSYDLLATSSYSWLRRHFLENLLLTLKISSRD